MLKPIKLIKNPEHTEKAESGGDTGFLIEGKGLYGCSFGPSTTPLTKMICSPLGHVFCKFREGLGDISGGLFGGLGDICG